MVDSSHIDRGGFIRGRRRFVRLAVLIALGAASTALAADGPVAYYPFDGDTDDASGWGNHAVALGAVPTEDRFGNPDSAYLVGNFGHLEAPDSDSLDISEAFTLSAWIRNDEMISTFGIIAGKGFNTAYSVSVYYGGGWTCPDPLASRRIQVSVGGATTRYSTGPTIDCGLGEWRHVVVAVSTNPGGNQLADLYLDGVYVDTIGMWGSFDNNTSPLAIGKDGETSDRFAGAIDDLRLFDRALMANEAVDLYHSIFTDGFEAGATTRWSVTAP